MWALRITMPGASNDEIIRALQAAIEVFDEVGVTPIQARDGMRFEAWDDRGMKENDRRLRKEDSWRAGLWLKASEAAQATLIESHPQGEVFRKFEMDLINMSNRSPDRQTALIFQPATACTLVAASRSRSYGRLERTRSGFAHRSGSARDRDRDP